MRLLNAYIALVHTSVRWCVTSKYVHTIQVLQIQFDDKADGASLESFLELTVHSR